MPPSGNGSPEIGEPKPLVILNDLHSDDAQAKQALQEFPIFPSFPTEICLAIWKCVLQRYRLISITVIDKDCNGSLPRSPPRSLSTSRNGLGTMISGEYYRLSVTTNHHLSPLLRMSRESRQAALEFYPVAFYFEKWVRDHDQWGILSVIRHHKSSP